jgi:hypothetical protein
MTRVAVTPTGLSEKDSAYLTDLLKRKLSMRTEVTFPAAGPFDCTICLGVDDSLPEDAFRIEDGGMQEIQVVGSSPRGVLYGIGKLLRTAVYEEGDWRGFRPGDWRGMSVPQRDVRGMYFATHFYNFYHCAPIEEVEAYIEDLALMGFNTITVWFDLHHYRSIQDADAQEMIARLHAILAAVQRFGLKPALLVLGNEGYNDSPLELRADWSWGHDGYFRDLPMYHVEVCPSKPAGYELILKWRREVFEAFADIDLDYVWIWPWDQGGCSCHDCAPWGGNGFLKIARPVAAMAREFFPKAKIILSTWYFDCYTTGEWETFDRNFSPDHDWADYLMAEFPGKFPDYVLQHGVPGGLPLLGFPEISMFQNSPWGGYGTNPLPGYLQKMWAEAGTKLSGGYPYSEGIFEDINKAVVAMYYWQGEGSPRDALLEYANYAYSSIKKDEIVQAVELMETTNQRQRLCDGRSEWMPKASDPLSDEQFVIARPVEAGHIHEILRAVDGQLNPAVRASWRWRVLFLRGLIDSELASNGFRSTQRCEEAFEELIHIYHADRAIWAVRPPAKRGRVLGW